MKSKKQQSNIRRRRCAISLSIILLFLVFFSVTSRLYSATWHINQDGSGDFTTIMEGVTAAVAYDTVRIHPGTYFENIHVERDLSLVSNYEYTGNEEDIHNTILDGNFASSVIKLKSYEASAIEIYICGFTIQNGIGWDDNFGNPKGEGGGIYARYTNLTLKKNIIQNNRAYSGGGIYLLESNVNLVGNTIRNNYSNLAGGIFTVEGTLVFDQDLLNNIYLNFTGEKGAEIFKFIEDPPINIIVDTFTVLEPDYFYLYSTNMYGHYQPDDITYDIQNAKIEPIEHDLYVAADGDDNNSGLTPADPLQNIQYALTLIKADSLNPRTIHIADGLYSASENNQYFPLHIKSYVSLIGESRENTILDRENEIAFVVANDILEGNTEFLQRDWSLQNLSLRNFSYYSAVKIQKNHNVLIKNLEITDDDGLAGAGITSHFNKINMDNIYLHDMIGVTGIKISGSNGSTVNLTNIKIDNIGVTTEQNITHPIWVDKNASSQPEFTTNIINAQITNNVSHMVDWPTDASALNALQWAKVNLINCTIADNSSITGGAVSLDESEVNIYNSILYGDVPREICLDGQYGPNTLSVQNSLVESGEEGILNIGTNFINWADNNLDENPLFVSLGNSYFLTEDSPCIDAGTLDLPEGVVMPAYDLAGNPRVSDSAIDMGCYEFTGDAAPIYLEVNSDTLSWSIPEGHFPNYYAIYLDEELLGTVDGDIMNYTFSNLVNGNSYIAGVSAVYGMEETAIIEIEFTYEETATTNDELGISNYELSNFPNPFNPSGAGRSPSTNIVLNLTEAGKTKLAIYNIKGQKVKQLIDAYLSRGEYTIEWNGKDENGRQCASGQYFLKLEQNGKMTASKLLLLK